MFRSSSEKVAVSFTLRSNTAVTTGASINKKKADLCIKGFFEPEQSVLFTLRLENYFQITETYGFIDTIN